MSESQRIKGGATDEAFKEQHFLWEKGVSDGVTFDLWARTYIKIET